jgi:acetate kinase
LEQAERAGDRNAKLALEVFAYHARKYIGAYAAALEGLDAVAFTGGIGEHSVSMRRRICQGLGFLGLRLDDELNGAADGHVATRISKDGAVQIWVIPTDEERQIARSAYEQLCN